MTCNRCADQAEAAMQAAGVPASQTQATWASDAQHPAQCLACGAFTTQGGECVSPRCALQRLLDDCPALRREDLAPGDAQAVEAARVALAQADRQTAQALRRLLNDCQVLSADGLEQSELATIEAARGIAGLSTSQSPELAQGGQAPDSTEFVAGLDGDRVSLIEHPKRRAQNFDSGPAYPQVLDTAAKRALYDGLGNDEQMALDLDRAIHQTKKDSWRGSLFKEREIKSVIYEFVRDEGRVECIFELVKSQREY